MRILQDENQQPEMYLRDVRRTFMTRFRILPVIVMLLAAPVRAANQTDPNLYFTLSNALEMAQKSNPEIRAAQKNWAAAKSRVSLEKTLEKPTLTYESMYSGDEKIIGVSQEFPFPGKLRAKSEAAHSESAMAEQDLRGKEREIRSQVKAAYAMYFLSVKSIEIFEQNVELMRRFAKVAESKYSVGKTNQTDVLRAQVELSKMLNMLVTLNQEKETAQAMLVMLMNLPPDYVLGAPQEPKVRRLRQSLSQLEAAALEHRPDLVKMRHHMHHTKLMLRSARLDYLPDMMAQFRTRSAMNSEMDNTQDFMVGFTLPLWFSKQKAMVRLSQAEKEMSEAEYESMKNRTIFNVKDLAVKAQTAERLVDLYRTSVIPQAEQALKIAESAYQSDRANFLEVVDVQRNLLQFRVEHYQHLAELEQWSAELESVMGKDLEEIMQ